MKNTEGFCNKYVLPELLAEVPVMERFFMWYMHDGAPPNFSLVARQFLDEHYRNRWIGRPGPQSWPPRSPNLNPLDYFLWDNLNHWCTQLLLK